MSQERWDVVLTFLQGPLSFQGDTVCRGPVVRLGTNPGPGGVDLSGYRGLDDRQAVISVYDGTSVTLAPVGNNQVRVATHPNVNWAELQPIRGPVQLSPGDAFHLGPPERGISITFAEARRLGVWAKHEVLSEAASANPDVEPTEVKDLDTWKGIPRWFIPAVLVVGISTAVIIFVNQTSEIDRDISPLGEGSVKGAELVLRVDESVEVEEEVLDGLRGPFMDFVVRPNAEVAGDDSLKEERNWDMRYFEFVSRSVVVHANSKAFWARLEQVKDDYAYVVQELQAADLPEIFAAIPYHESQYRSSNQSPACAEGYWQFQPEVANRMKLEVAQCRFRGETGEGSYTPSRIVPKIGVLKNAVYVEQTSNGGYRCRIEEKGCAVDERRNLALSTQAALKMFEQPYHDDDLIRRSGVAVQATILSHNTGYWDERYDRESGPRRWNIRPALERFVKRHGSDRTPQFYGDSITCVGEEYSGIANSNKSCNSVLLNQPQQYAYSVTAVHFLAVCYYAMNYGGDEPFRTWRKRYEDRYCSTLSIPTKEQARKWGGR